jgi:hypothetical protein
VSSRATMDWPSVAAAKKGRRAHPKNANLDMVMQ